MEALAREHLAGIAPAEVPAVSLVRYPEDAEDRLVAAILYGYAVHPLAQIEERVRHALARGEGARSSTNTSNGAGRTISPCGRSST